MPAYYRATISEFLKTDPNNILGRLQAAYAADGFSSQYSKQTLAWESVIPLFKEQFRSLIQSQPAAEAWTIILEYPLYRLRRRIDAVLLTRYPPG